MNCQVAPVRQVVQHLVRNAAKPDLKRRVVTDEPSNVAGDLFGNPVRRVVQVFDDRRIDAHEPVDALGGDAAFTASPRHRRIDLGDEGPGRERRCSGDVDRDPEAAGSVPVRRRHLHHRDVDRHSLVSEQSGDVRDRDRDVFDSTGIDERPDVLPDIEDSVSVVGRRRVTDADAVGEEVDEHDAGRGLLEPLESVHESARGGAGTPDEDVVPRPDRGHRFRGRGLTARPIARRVGQCMQFVTGRTVGNPVRDRRISSFRTAQAMSRLVFERQAWSTTPGPWRRLCALRTNCHARISKRCLSRVEAPSLPSIEARGALLLHKMPANGPFTDEQ